MDQPQTNTETAENNSLLSAGTGSEKAVESTDNDSLLSGGSDKEKVKSTSDGTSKELDGVKVEEKKPDDKPDEKKTEEKKVPEKYEFKAPEGMQLDAKLVEQFSPVAKELGLTNEQAQKLVDMYGGNVKEMQEAGRKQEFDTRKAWREEIKAMPDSAEHLWLANKALAKFGDIEAKQLLGGKDSWLADNPVMIRFLAKIGKVISDDTFVEGSTTPQSTKVDKAKGFYPNSNMK